MNRKRWSNPEIPVSVLALKLCEEAAEVGTEVTDAMMKLEFVNISNLLEELDHVDFISSLIRSRAEYLQISRKPEEEVLDQQT